MALAYYGTKLSPHWVETPEGYLICKNAVIGRTGFQTYRGRELDRDELRDQGITVADDQEVELFRSADEVFAAKTIASFEGKSVTDGHPPELLSLDTVKQHEDGQVLNVRAGSEPLESGDFPLLADLMIKAKNLIEKIKAGLRELSCGYNYHVLADGTMIKQVDIVGNHVAIVETARAGREAAIVDSIDISIEKKDILMTIPILDRILSSNRKSRLATWAKDAKPEEIADAFDHVISEVEKVSVGKDEKEKEKADDSKDAAADAATDAGKDRKRLHDALDRFLEKGETLDEELAGLFKKGGKDSADADDADDASDAASDEEEEEEEEGKKKKAEDQEEAEDEEAGALTIEPSDRTVSLGPGTDELREAKREGAIIMLKALKPFVAKSGNKKLIAAFDTAARTVQGKSAGKTSGGYGKFAVAANKRGKDAQDSMQQGPNEALKKIQDAEKLYKDRFTARQ